MHRSVVGTIDALLNGMDTLPAKPMMFMPHLVCGTGTRCLGSLQIVYTTADLAECPGCGAVLFPYSPTEVASRLHEQSLSPMYTRGARRRLEVDMSVVAVYLSIPGMV
jgi:hypothetical protein